MAANSSADRRGSKAGRNEGRKLTASALNNGGVAFVLAGLLQPALAFVQQQRPIDLAGGIASLIFLAVSGVLFWVAQRVVRGLED